MMIIKKSAVKNDSNRTLKIYMVRSLSNGYFVMKFQR